MDTLIFTDGACSGNPGPGGWAAHLAWKTHYKEISGHDDYTTNNRMELTAILEALKCLKKNTKATLYSDSNNSIRWLKGEFKRKNPVIKELCGTIDELIRIRNLDITFVYQSDDHPLIQRVDQLAKMEALNNV